MARFDDYVDPVGRPAAPPDENAPATSLGLGVGGGAKSAYEGPDVGYGEDIAKGTVGGLGRGTAGVIGGGGSLGNLVHAGLSKVGVPEDYIKTGAKVVSGIPYLKAFTGPSADQVQSAIENYTGKFYEPKTVPGQYASTVAEFAPAALMPGGGGGSLLRTIGTKAFNTVVPALTSETAGQLTKGTAAEPYARFVAGMAAGPLAGKLITPSAPASPFRQVAAVTLEGEGIPLTAGQRTGSKPLQWLEASAADMPGSAGRAQQLNAEQAAALNRAYTGKVYDPAQLRARGVPEGTSLPAPEVVVAGKRSLGDEYDRLSLNTLRSDPQLHGDLAAARTHYEGNTLPSQRGTGSRDLNQLHNELVDKLVAGQGTMPGSQYQAIRSRFGKLADSSTDPYLAEALQRSQAALDQAMRRGLPPADAAAWDLNNLRYARMKALEPVVAKAGENLSPQAMAQALRSGRSAQYATQTSDLDRLAKAADVVIKPMPQSGTAARLGWQHLFGVLGTGASGGYMGGTPGAVLGLGAAAAPFAFSRAAISRPGQAYLGNQVLPQNARDIVAQALMQQAISQPSGIARNEAEQAAYERKRKDDLRKIGLQ